MDPYLMNPFGKKGRITDPKDFFDREDLLNRLLDNLAKGVNISLVGESQIGKSSILSKVIQAGPNQLGLSPEAFVYINMQIIRNEDQFFSALCDRLGIENCRGFELYRKLDGKRYVICIDEIEKMTNTENFPGEVRHELRGFSDGTDRPFTLLISSRSPLDKLFPDADGMTSPLANICRQINIEPFPLDVARAFLTEKLHGTEVEFTEKQMEQLLSETNGHPGRLQEAAANLYDSIISGST